MTASSFTSDWTSVHVPKWRQALAPLADQKARLLEIGCWEGRSTIFFLDYLPRAQITCVDTFDGFGNTAPVAGAEARFDENLAPYAGRVEKLKGRSIEVLDRLAREGRRFDFIYVDGSHRTEDVLCDTLLAWPMLQPGGLLIWDDYRHKKPGERPLLAVEAFALIASDAQILHRGEQAHARKIAAASSRGVQRISAAIRLLSARRP